MLVSCRDGVSGVVEIVVFFMGYVYLNSRVHTHVSGILTLSTDTNTQMTEHYIYIMRRECWFHDFKAPRDLISHRRITGTIEVMTCVGH